MTDVTPDTAATGFDQVVDRRHNNLGHSVSSAQHNGPARRFIFLDFTAGQCREHIYPAGVAIMCLSLGNPGLACHAVKGNLINAFGEAEATGNIEHLCSARL